MKILLIYKSTQLMSKKWSKISLKKGRRLKAENKQKYLNSKKKKINLFSKDWKEKI